MAIASNAAWIGVDTLTKLWRDLTDAVARDWPGHPDPLDDNAVLRRLHQLAEQVPGQSPAIRRQVIDDAPGIILLAFRTFQPNLPFNRWARTVLYHHAVSLYRRDRRMCPDSASLDTLESPLALPEDHLAEVLHEFRRLCDTAEFPRRTATGPELRAVFALETRLRLLAHLVRQGPAFLDSHLPLRHWERAQRIQPDWPALGELWDCLAHTPEPGLRNLDAVRRACRQLAPTAAVDGLHRLWNTWLNRARTAVQRQLESHAQARLFFYLFPTHQPGEAGDEPDAVVACRQAS
jgi:hypothetical protein